MLSGALPRGAFMLHALPLLTAAAVLLQRVSGRAESMGLQGEASVPQLQDVLPCMEQLATHTRAPRRAMHTGITSSRDCELA